MNARQYEITLEYFDSRFDAILDGLGIIIAELKKKADQSTVDEILRRLDTMELVEKHHGQKLNDHETRITKLEIT